MVTSRTKAQRTPTWLCLAVALLIGLLTHVTPRPAEHEGDRVAKAIAHFREYDDPRRENEIHTKSAIAFWADATCCTPQVGAFSFASLVPNSTTKSWVHPLRDDSFYVAANGLQDLLLVVAVLCRGRLSEFFENLSGLDSRLLAQRDRLAMMFETLLEFLKLTHRGVDVELLDCHRNLEPPAGARLARRR